MRTSFRSALLVVSWLLAFGTVDSIAQDKYFPKNALSYDSQSDQRKADWYSHELRVLEEPSLLKLADDTSLESYRFLWLRTFHHPVAIRLDVKADGTGTLTTKIANVEAGFPRAKPAHLLDNASRQLTLERTQEFLAQVKRASFWSLPSHVDDQTGTDGSQWIIEGVKGGKYHVVDRWSPNEGAVRELGLALALRIGQMKIQKGEIY